MRFPRWFSEKQISILKKKNNGRRRSKRSYSNNDYLAFFHLRKEIRKELDHCLKNYALKDEGDLWSKPVNLWKYVNGYQKNFKLTPPVVDGCHVGSTGSVLQVSGKYFMSVDHKFDQDDID